MADGSWNWCMCKSPEWTEVSTFGYSSIGRMCTSCGGKVGALWGKLKLKVCPQCGDEMPEENDFTGEGPVYWKVTWGPMCSMECVTLTHREWLEREKMKLLNQWFPGV